MATDRPAAVMVRWSLSALENSPDWTVPAEDSTRSEAPERRATTAVQSDGCAATTIVRTPTQHPTVTTKREIITARALAASWPVRESGGTRRCRRRAERRSRARRGTPRTWRDRRLALRTRRGRGRNRRRDCGSGTG